MRLCKITLETELNRRLFMTWIRLLIHGGFFSLFTRPPSPRFAHTVCSTLDSCSQEVGKLVAVIGDEVSSENARRIIMARLNPLPIFGDGTEIPFCNWKRVAKWNRFSFLYLRSLLASYQIDTFPHHTFLSFSFIGHCHWILVGRSRPSNSRGFQLFDCKIRHKATASGRSLSKSIHERWCRHHFD